MNYQSSLQVLKELALFEITNELEKSSLVRMPSRYSITINSIVEELDEILAFIKSSGADGRTTKEVKKNFVNEISDSVVKERLSNLVNENSIYRVDEKRNTFMTCVYYAKQN